MFRTSFAREPANGSVAILGAVLGSPAIMGCSHSAEAIEYGVTPLVPAEQAFLAEIAKYYQKDDVARRVVAMDPEARAKFVKDVKQSLNHLLLPLEEHHESNKLSMWSCFLRNKHMSRGCLSQRRKI